MYDYKFQIASLAILVILLINFSKNQKLPLMSTRFFSVFLGVSTVNVISDIVTVYTINHIETVGAFWNRLAHQFFIGSLDVLTYFLYLYVLIFTNHQKRPSVREVWLQSIPVVVSLMMVLFAPLYYNLEARSRYSYGPMATTVYASVGIYMGMLLVRVVRRHSAITTNQRNLILSGTGVWIIVALIQLMHPTLLLSSLGLTLMVILVYLSLENPRENTDGEVNTLNREAFHTILPEMVESHKHFYLVNIVIDHGDYIQDKMGYKEIWIILRSIVKHLKKISRTQVYHSRGKVLSLIVQREEMLRVLENMAQTWKVEYENDHDGSFQPTYHMDVIECPKYARNIESLLYLMDYMMVHPQGENCITHMNDEFYASVKTYQTIEKIVEDAVANAGFDVFYQPIYSTKTGRFSSAEALVRLQDTDTLGYISPEVFIPIAEKKGLIKQLGNIVFEKVCMFAKEYDLAALGVEYLEVNLSGIQGMDKNLVPVLKGYMEQYQIDPSFINLEITETASVEAGEVLIDNMRELREVGCRFSMDDFGTGYSNLSQIAKVPFELIKLDKSLIWPYFEKNNKEAVVILVHCIEMIHQLGREMVAEGVETKEQAEALVSLGVTHLQGFYFSRPIPREAYLGFLKNKKG